MHVTFFFFQLRVNTYKTLSEVIVARKSGIVPFRLLFDRSLNEQIIYNIRYSAFITAIILVWSIIVLINLSIHSTYRILIFCSLEKDEDTEPVKPLLERFLQDT